MNILHDATLALRSHVRSPGFAVTVILTLTVSVGAVITALALVNGAVLRPLPYPEPSRLVSIVDTDAQGATSPLPPPSLPVLRDHTQAFDLLAGFSPSWELYLAGRTERMLTVAYLSAGAFDLFGVVPVEGRLFAPEEYRDRRPVAVVTRSLWRREFGEVPLRSQSILLEGTAHTVVGIVPDDLRMPITASPVNQAPAPAEAWLPFSLNPFVDAPNVPVMNVVGRLRPGMTVPQATQELTAAAAALPVAPAAREHSLQAVSLAELVSTPARRPLALLLAGVVCLLLICAANIVGLVVARTAHRAGELAMRRALGASRARLVVQLSVDAGLLVTLGTAGGVLLAGLTLASLPALLLSGLPPSATLAIDARVVIGAITLAGLGTLAIGVWPALHATSNLGHTSGTLSARHTAGAALRRTRSLLTVAEVALAVTLLMGAGLMARSFWVLSRTDPGIQADGLLATGVSFEALTYPSADHRRAFIDRAVEQMRGLPGVSAVSAVNRLPFGGSNVTVELEVEGRTSPDGRSVAVDRRVATSDYFRTIGVPIVVGRDFDIEDTPDATDRVAIVNEAAARVLFGSNQLGRRVRLALRGGPGPWMRVIGIVADVRHHGLGAPIAPEVYVPYAQAPVESMVFVVRSPADAGTLTVPMRQTLKRLDPDMRVLESQQRVVSHLVQESIAEPRLRALLANGFAAVALVLAAIGIVGIVSITVSQARRDIGVRLALGARHDQIVRRVVGSSMGLVGLGAAIGLGTGWVLSRFLAGLLFGVAPLDLPTMAIVVPLVAGVGWIAAYLPARRILAIEPIEILRPE